MLDQILDRMNRGWYSSAAAYQRHLGTRLRKHGKNRDLAFADAIGSESLELFVEQGDGQVAILKHHGLADGMTVYDLGCGCGRTAQALLRSGWSGRYIGADIVSEFIAELKRKCPGYEAHVNRRPTIVSDDASLDMIFHWSVFTHLSPEECYLYLEDCFRALKPGGKLVFSFLEMTNEEHFTATFESRLRRLRRGKSLHLLDTFLHPDWIRVWADKIDFSEPRFTHGQDARDHPPAWQTVAVMTKPLGQSSSS
jgi:2-polyprenyl-3-methyl-5-hydroxy-6-metoxy-1,4-benzoquinol methylase